MTKHSNKSSLLYNYIITDENNKIIKKSRVKKAESYVANFINTLCACFAEDWYRWSAVPMITTTGILYTKYNKAMSINGALGDLTRGIIVGSGTTAVDIEDYRIDTIIAHGTGAGQLQYSAVSFGAPTQTASVIKFIVTRTFTNGTGSDVTIREIGLYGVNDNSFLLIRDILTSPETIANNEKITFNYTIQTSL